MQEGWGYSLSPFHQFLSGYLQMCIKTLGLSLYHRKHQIQVVVDFVGDKKICLAQEGIYVAQLFSELVEKRNKRQ